MIYAEDVLSLHPVPGSLASQNPRANEPIYTTEGMDGAIRQAEIIAKLIRYDHVMSNDEPNDRMRPVTVGLSVVISQDCDLQQDFRCQSGDASYVAKDIENVLLCEVRSAEEVRTEKFANSDRPVINSAVWGSIKSNHHERYQFLEKVPPHQDLSVMGLPELVVDFKRYFTLPRDDVYRQITPGSAQGASRRCRIMTPYREHLQSRFANHLSRIGLPLDHQSDPA